MTEDFDHPNFSDRMLSEFGFVVGPEDQNAVSRCMVEISEARRTLRPLLPGDEPAPVFDPAKGGGRR